MGKWWMRGTAEGSCGLPACTWVRLRRVPAPLQEMRHPHAAARRMNQLASLLVIRALGSPDGRPCRALTSGAMTEPGRPLISVEETCRGVLLVVVHCGSAASAVGAAASPRCTGPSSLGRSAERGRRPEPARSAVRPAGAGEPDGGGEADEGEYGQGDHRQDVGGVPEARSRPGSCRRSLRRRTSRGWRGQRQPGDLRLQLFGEAGLHEVDRGGQHDPEAKADQQQAGREGDDPRRGPTRASRSPIPAIVTTKPAMIRVFCGRRLASAPRRATTRTPTARGEDDAGLDGVVSADGLQEDGDGERDPRAAATGCSG